jgi:hypothetical protein
MSNEEINEKIFRLSEQIKELQDALGVVKK